MQREEERTAAGREGPRRGGCWLDVEPIAVRSGRSGSSRGSSPGGFLPSRALPGPPDGVAWLRCSPASPGSDWLFIPPGVSQAWHLSWGTERGPVRGYHPDWSTQAPRLPFASFLPSLGFFHFGGLEFILGSSGLLSAPGDAGERRAPRAAWHEGADGFSPDDSSSSPCRLPVARLSGGPACRGSDGCGAVGLPVGPGTVCGVEDEWPLGTRLDKQEPASLYALFTKVPRYTPAAQPLLWREWVSVPRCGGQHPPSALAKGNLRFPTLGMHCMVTGPRMLLPLWLNTVSAHSGLPPEGWVHNSLYPLSQCTRRALLFGVRGDQGQAPSPELDRGLPGSPSSLSRAGCFRAQGCDPAALSAL